ncbi:FxsB family cyclophane-forming radical SAM/SPASM peptide maturase [Asanoa siamensis]|uniref:Radical SAM core domain-containing protein n=1 Tax=Asanoa siamensis TaxID=926357 RepID=A0ABQ4CNS2_9ACTN|nr:FxsB family cyclophane-forming radical SAM/SPASM peptide maturase [Asanoa siamensis]GIF72921.1 hypothetical protein Asi02nite_24390 [Asanoa siamensis]
MPDTAGRITGGPHPLRQFVLKVHGRCDLACDHCYVFEHADQSWRQKSKMITPATVRAVAGRIAEHASAWHLPSVSVIVHGGEPLLLGAHGLRSVLTELRATIAPVTDLRLVMQTNGVLLTESICDVLLEFGVKIGVSLDGDRSANDLHRRFRNGASSHEQVRRALAMLRRPEYRSLFGGILCTIDVRNDPVAVYEALRDERPPSVDFLLPHATWDTPPLRPGDDTTPYATWLGVIHANWVADGRPMRIRMFESLLSTADGGPGGSEQLGTDAADLLVIDTDGSWEQVDSLKTAYAGAPDTGMSVFSHSVDEVSRHPAVHERQIGVAGLSATCQACPLVRRCGGGLYAHRFRTGSGFDNPSVYCADLQELIMNIDGSERAQQARVRPTEAEHTTLLDEIATGHGGTTAIRWLADSQLSITRALVVGVADLPRADTTATAGWETLVAIERAAPAAVDQVLAHPYLRPWAVAMLNKPDERVSRLANLAAAAGLRAGVETEVVVPVAGGLVHLPGLGTVRLGEAHDGTAVLSTGHQSFTVHLDDEKLYVDLAGPAAPWWQPAPRITDDGLDLIIEHGDPHRDCHGWGLASAPEEAPWRQAVGDAWSIIKEESPHQVDGLRAGLMAIVPLAADEGDKKRASTARDAFGSVAAAPTDPASLAVILVHEFQHSKLGAVLDMYDLFDPNSPVTMRVGWRPDERPIEGVFQGTYAHLAVAEIWGRRAARPGPDQAEAEKIVDRYRAWTLAAVDGLRGSGALTALGERFVERMAGATETWR